MIEQNRRNDQPLDDRAESYKISGDMVAAIARHHCDIDVDEMTLERWRELMGLMREVDTWADDTNVSREEVIGQLETFDMFTSRYPNLAPGELADNARASLVSRADRILQVGERVMTEESLRRFVVYRMVEARETVNMFEDTAAPHVVEQPQFQAEFMPVLRALGEAATLWDSLIDARQDVKAGRQRLQPDRLYYTKVAGAMMRRGKLGGTALLHYEPSMFLMRKAGHRIKNRIKHGVQPYSTLYRFTKDM